MRVLLLEETSGLTHRSSPLLLSAAADSPFLCCVVMLHGVSDVALLCFMVFLMLCCYALCRLIDCRGELLNLQSTSRMNRSKSSNIFREFTDLNGKSLFDNQNNNNFPTAVSVALTIIQFCICIKKVP